MFDLHFHRLDHCHRRRCGNKERLEKWKMENEKEWKFQATMKMRFFLLRYCICALYKFPFNSSLERDTSTGSADYLFLHLFIYLFTKQ